MVKGCHRVSKRNRQDVDSAPLRDSPVPLLHASSESLSSTSAGFKQVRGKKLKRRTSKRSRKTEADTVSVQGPPQAAVPVSSESSRSEHAVLKQASGKKSKRQTSERSPRTDVGDSSLEVYADAPVLPSPESLRSVGSKKARGKKLKRAARLAHDLLPSEILGSESSGVKKKVSGKKLKRAASSTIIAAGSGSGIPMKHNGEDLQPDNAKAARIWREAVPSAPQANGFHTFAVDALDHAETDPRAYADISPCLRILAKQLGKNPDALHLWDPYFCKGSVKIHLKKLGFPRTYNANEDFYAVVKSGNLPPHDAIISSPPYSGDHLERCMRYVVESKKPWFLLLPNWVAKKDYFIELMNKETVQPFFVAPTKRYTYWMPLDLCKKGSSRPDWVKEDGGTSPYHTTWFVHLRSSTSQEKAFNALNSLKGPSSRDVVIGRSMNAVKWKMKKKGL